MGGYTLLHNVLGWPAGVVPVTRVRADEESDRPPSSDLVEKVARRSELAVPPCRSVCRSPHRASASISCWR